jgi:hypothetical protein
MEQRTPPGKEGLYSSLQNLAAACNLHQRLRPWPKRLWYRKGRSPWTGVPGVNPKFSDDHTESKVERNSIELMGPKYLSGVSGMELQKQLKLKLQYPEFGNSD